ncbi:hypothetical protein GmHk_04G009966 [Glycine max]|nr:hypothetical protein GmHk_04G009966 [Glycine max]
MSGERGERDTGWESVRNRRERREKGPRLSIDRKRNQDHHRYQRERNDITSFYFTRFPEEITKKDLWWHFKQVGDVREIFISPKRNKMGKRYGFVRFKGVQDVHQVEKKLDSMVFGGLKMFVNTPRYGRPKREYSQVEAKGRTGGKYHLEGSKELALTLKTGKKEHIQQGSYAEVVRRHSSRAAQRGILSNGELNCNSSRSSVNLEIQGIGQQWLKGAWIGRLKNMAMFERIEEYLWWDIGDNIYPKYIGDDMVLLHGLTEQKAKRMLEEDKEGWGEVFTSLEPWNLHIRAGSRLTWVHCWGIPLMAWDMQHIKKIVASIGEMVGVDDDVEELNKLDIARILIRTSWKPLIQHSANVHIQGESYEVHIVEESGKSCANCQRRQWSDHGSSEEIQSDESEDGTTWGEITVPRAGNSCKEGTPSKQGSAEGEERMEVTNMHVGETQETSTIPVAANTFDSTRGEAPPTEEQEKPSEPKNSYQSHNSGAEGDERLRVITGLHAGPEPRGKDSDRKVIPQSAPVQTEDVQVQVLGRKVQGTDQLSMTHKEGLRQKGTSDPGESADKYHQRGKGGSVLNVEDRKRGFIFEKPCDQHMGWEVDGAVTIHTPNKICNPQLTDPNSSTQAQGSSWQVYSRKGRGKKKQAQLCGANSPRDFLASELVASQPQHQKMIKNPAEDQISDPLQQHTAQSQRKHDGDFHQLNDDGDFQSARNYQEAESTWRMVTELGLTTRHSQKNYVQKLLELESRDVEEVERLGSRRLNQ